tara:strand:- start:231 stop:725 length:495 start_codon:yes stop_codon:yes gene_type:complete
VNQRQKQIFKTRANNIIGNSKEDFKKINVNLELQKAFALSATFARNELTFINSFKKFPLMKYFVQDPYRWNILNYIIYFSAKKEPIYLEKLKSYIQKSDRHVEKILKDCLANGSFIVLDPQDKVLKDKKIVSIRPSEKLMKEFYGHNILKYRKFINIIKRFNFK